jgi:hypothetical protein
VFKEPSLLAPLSDFQTLGDIQHDDFISPLLAFQNKKSRLNKNNEEYVDIRLIHLLARPGLIFQTESLL